MNELVHNILTSQELANFLVFVIVTTGTSVVAAVGYQLRNLFKTKLSAEQQKLLIVIATQAVIAAEQLGVGQVGEEKLAEALKFAQNRVDEAGIKISVEDLRKTLEAALWNEINQYKPKAE